MCHMSNVMCHMLFFCLYFSFSLFFTFFIMLLLLSMSLLSLLSFLLPLQSLHSVQKGCEDNTKLSHLQLPAGALFATILYGGGRENRIVRPIYLPFVKYSNHPTLDILQSCNKEKLFGTLLYFNSL